MSTTEQIEEPISIINRINNKILSTQFCWWLGHISTLYSGIFYYINIFSSQGSQKLYNKSLTGALLSYTIVLAATHKNFQPNVDYAKRIAKDETFLYLILAIFWKFYPSNLFCLVPYLTYSFFHFANYLKSDIIPTIFPQVSKETEERQTNTNASVSQPTEFALLLQSTVNQYYSSAVKFSAFYEITVIPLFLFIMFLTKFQIFRLGFYALFLFQRYGQSQLIQSSFTELRLRLDASILRPGNPEAVQKVYTMIQQTLISVGQSSLKFNAHAKSR